MSEVHGVTCKNFHLWLLSFLDHRSTLLALQSVPTLKYFLSQPVLPPSPIMISVCSKHKSRWPFFLLCLDPHLGVWAPAKHSRTTQSGH